MKTQMLGLIMALIIPLVPTGPAQAQLDALRKFALGKDGDKQIAYFKIKGTLTETPTRFPPLFGGDPPLSLKELLEGFKEARHDNNVVAIVIDLQHAALGFAQLQEIHAAIRKFAAVDLAKRGHKMSTTKGPIAHPVMIFVDHDTGTFYAAGDPAARRHAGAID